MKSAIANAVHQILKRCPAAADQHRQSKGNHFTLLGDIAVLVVTLLHTLKIRRALSRSNSLANSTACVSVIDPWRTKSSARMPASSRRYMSYLGRMNSSL